LCLTLLKKLGSIIASAERLQCLAWRHFGLNDSDCTLFFEGVWKSSSLRSVHLSFDFFHSDVVVEFFHAASSTPLSSALSVLILSRLRCKESG
jgi:CelD/BcsL family acetyltransferase involved in cellulose biosynthesis